MMRNPSKIINPNPITTPMPKKNPAAAYSWHPDSPYNQLDIEYCFKTEIKEKYFDTHDPLNEEDAEKGNCIMDIPIFIIRKLHNSSPGH